MKSREETEKSGQPTFLEQNFANAHFRQGY